jgi:hypothetical protein
MQNWQKNTMTISKGEIKMMKKVFTGFLLVGSLAMANTQAVTIDKQVTGVNKESLETRTIKAQNQVIKDSVKISNADISTEQLRNQQQKVNVQNNKDLEDELSKGVEKKSSLWKWIVGAATVVGAIIIL